MYGRSVLLHQIHHVHRHDHGNPQLHDLRGKVQIPFDIGAVHNIYNYIRLFMNQIIPRHHLLQRIGRQGIDTRQIRDYNVSQGIHAKRFLQPSLLLFHRDAGPVPHELVRAGKGIVQCSLAAVWISCQRYFDRHLLFPSFLLFMTIENSRSVASIVCCVHSTSIISASALRRESSYPLTVTSTGSPSGATFLT